MSNLKLRVILIFTAVPFLFFAVFFLPHFHFLAISVIGSFFLIKGSYETWKLFYGKYNKIDFTIITAIAFIIPITVYFESAEIIPYNTIYYLTGIIIFIIFSYHIFNRNENTYSEINKKTSAMIILLFYPGIFFSYSLRFSTLHYPSYAITFFMIIVFFNDISAYIAGMLWGKNNRNIMPISPKKSVAGFIAGFLSSIFSSLLCYFFKPAFFAGKYKYAIGTGIIIGILTIVGDLCESAMKRSANLKDSGDVIPGRGGVLDNIDSIILTAPVYYFIIKYISING
jgi:phosphatidate cytidylyltransferase